MKKTLRNKHNRHHGSRLVGMRSVSMAIRAGERAFTLIELLVVIAIIGLLSSVVLFSVQSGREKAYETKRAQDVRQLQIASELRLLEKIPIPVAAIPDEKFYAENSAKSDGAPASFSPSSILKFITLQPNEAFADSATFAASTAYYDSLFVNGLFFKPGTTKPQDPQCVAGQPNTCYRAYYNGRTLVIVASLRTKKHTGSFAANVQYGMAVGNVSDNDFVSTCQAIGYPAYSTAQSAVTDPASSCIPVAAGPSSIIQGITNGRDITGLAGTGSI